MNEVQDSGDGGNRSSRRAAAALAQPAAALHVAEELVPAAPVLTLAAVEPAAARRALALGAPHQRQLGQRAAADEGGRQHGGDDHGGERLHCFFFFRSSGTTNCFGIKA